MYKDNVVDPFATKICLKEALAEYDKTFEERWRSAIRAFRTAVEDSLYLIGPSSYLFTLAGEKIAVDPQIRRDADLVKVEDTIVNTFGSLSAILITHEHDDHFCMKLTRMLKDTPVVWYLPKGMKASLIEESGLKPERIRYVCEGDEIRLGAVTIRVFESPHVPFGKEKTIVECGYELSAASRHVLLPGDIREYGYQDYPPIHLPDVCIAHLWAGNDMVHPEAYLPRLEEAADFFARLKAKQYWFGHLYKIGREQHKMCDVEHAELLGALLKKRLPHCDTLVPLLGYGYRLFSEEEIK